MKITLDEILLSAINKQKVFKLNLISKIENYFKFLRAKTEYYSNGKLKQIVSNGVVVKYLPDGKVKSYETRFLKYSVNYKQNDITSVTCTDKSVFSPKHSSQNEVLMRNFFEA